MNRMHILITSWRDIKNPLSGGAETLTHEISKRLAKRGHQITIISGKFPGAKTSEIIDGVEVIRPSVFSPTKAKDFMRWLFFLRALKTEVKRREKSTDVVIDQIHGLPSMTYLYSQKPVILFPLEFAGKIWDYEIPFPGNLIGKILEKHYIATCKNLPFITISPSVASEFKLLGVKHIHVITPGLSHVKIKLPTKTTYPSFITLGRITKMKRLEDTIEAFSLFQNHTPKSTLHIVGCGKSSYLRNLKKLISDKHLDSQIQMHGFVSVESKTNLLAQSWALISTSVAEGWGLNVIEAAAVGTPTLAYNVTGVVDSIHNNQTGMLTAINTPQELSKLMLKISQNRTLRTRLSLAAKNHSLQFSWEKSTDQFLNAIQTTLRGST